MAILSVIRRWHLRDGVSIREIARRSKLSRNTIRKYLASAVVEPRYPRRKSPSKLDGFAAKLTAWLVAEARKGRKQRRNLRRLYADLAVLGFQGSYDRVAAFARSWRQTQQEVARTAGRGTFVPLTFAPGEAFQFDWSEDWAVVAGERTKFQVAQFKLSYSRAFFLRAYLLQTHEMLFDAHAHAFAVLGGVPRRGIYDNMKTAVDRVPGRGKARIVNARFSALCAHYLFDPDFCNVASGWEKGRVEKGVQDSRRRIWQSALEQRFGSFAELNEWLTSQCVAARQAAHPECPGMTIAVALEHEQPHLMPMPAAFDGYVESPARVSSTSLVSAARNRYSVPCTLAGQRVSVRLYPDRVVIVDDQTVVAEHVRASDREHVVYDWQHYVPLVQRKPGALRNGAPFADLPETLQRLRQALIRRPGGDRVMAQVLAAVPTFGLEAVLVAIDLVLQSGRPSAEHVLNVLARLHEGPPPERVDTALVIADEPVADTERYDRLREEVGHG